jgi:signal transduction histidine kinase
VYRRSVIAPAAPVPQLVAAFRRVSAEPSGPDEIGAALGQIAVAHGLAGIRLQLDAAEPLPNLETGWGSLVNAADGAGLEFGGRDEAAIGRIWVDGDDRARTLALASVATAIDAARAHVRADRARQHLAALDAALRGIAGVQSVDSVLQLIVDRCRDLAGAQYAALGIVDANGAIEAFLTSGIDAATRTRIGPLPRGHGLLGLIIRESSSFRIPDIELDPRRHGFPPHHPAMHSFLGVPIKVGGDSVGNLYLTNKLGQPQFSADDQELVERFAMHAGIAIDNARLHRGLQQLSVLEERDRIGRDLHDTVIQRIYAVGLSLDDVPAMMETDPVEASAHVDAAIESLNATIREIREFIFILRPPGEDPASLAGSVRSLADEMRMQTGMPVEVRADADLPPMAGTRTGQVLAIVREALANVARHAGATSVSVELQAGEAGMTLRIVDDGIGFDPAATVPPGHQGLRNMLRRTESLGGTFEIDSGPARGTRIIVWLPTSSAKQESR